MGLTEAIMGSNAVAYKVNITSGWNGHAHGDVFHASMHDEDELAAAVEAGYLEVSDEEVTPDEPEPEAAPAVGVEAPAAQTEEEKE